MTETGSELLRAEAVTKAFPGVLANDAVDFDLRSGEIHAVIGENGAGKTTLMGILFGLRRPDSGSIRFLGEAIVLEGPRDAIARGIGFVQQHYSLIPTLTVLDNIVLSQRYGGGLRSRAAVARKAADLARRFRLAIDLGAPVERLSPGEQQRVELVKALIGDPRVLILDEPAALLSQEEVRGLWHILKGLAAAGVGIVLIGHKLEDVLAVADRITVLRRGRAVATVAAAAASPASLAALMIGDIREHARVARPAAGVASLPVLEAASLDVTGDRGQRAVRGVSLAVGRGEILGIAGLTDSGQVELLETLAGSRPAAAGEVRLDGTDITGLPVRARQRLGIAYVPADRRRDGLVGPLSLADNLALAPATDPAVSRAGLLRLGVMAERARSLIGRFDIRAPGPGARAATLSGGNQQKLILARELARDPEVILCCYPTRGLDFAATAAIHDELRRAADRGAAVLVASIDLDELFGLADRLLVMQGGRVVGEVLPGGYSAERIGLMMGGEAAA